MLKDWQGRIEHGQDPVPCEIELWYRRGMERRSRARNRVADLVERLEGRVTAEADIKEIDYHALLVRLPGTSVRTLIERRESDIALVKCEQIQFSSRCSMGFPCRRTACFRVGSWSMTRPIPVGTEPRWRRSFCMATWPRMSGLSRSRCTFARSSNWIRVTG